MPHADVDTIVGEEVLFVGHANLDGWDHTVPFLDRLFSEYPVLDYPPNAPSPELGVLVDGWNVEVIVGDAPRRTYRRADSSKTILMELRTL